MYPCALCQESKYEVSYFDHTESVFICLECDQFMGRLERTLNYLGINLERLGSALRYVEAQNASKAATDENADASSRADDQMGWQHDGYPVGQANLSAPYPG